jgi:hypothetical protein
MDSCFSKSDRSKEKRERNEAAMREAIALLKSEGVRFVQPDKWTLQFGAYSYWPGTQRLYREDDESSLPNQGPSEITALVRSLKRPAPPPRKIML